MPSRAFHVSRLRRQALPKQICRGGGHQPLQQRARLLLQLKLLTLVSTEVFQVTFFSKYPRLQTPESI